MIGSNLQQNRTSYILSRNLDAESCCDQFYCMKGNIAWTNRSYDILFMCDVIYPTMQYYNMDTATWFNNKLTSLIYDGDRAVDWTQAKMMEGSSATN